ncbi:MAG: hypothetical protein WAV76_11635 [Bacteroidota bacterium]
MTSIPELHSRVRTLMASIQTHAKSGTLSDAKNDINELQAIESPSMFVPMYLWRLESFQKSGVLSHSDIESLDRLFVLILRDLQSKEKTHKTAENKNDLKARHDARKQALEEKFLQLIDTAQNSLKLGRYERAQNELNRAGILFPGHSLLGVLKKEITDAETAASSDPASHPYELSESAISSIFLMKLKEAIAKGNLDSAKAILTEALLQDPLNETLLEYRQNIETAAAKSAGAQNPGTIHDLESASYEHITALLEEIRIELRNDPLNEQLQTLVYEYENAARRKKIGQHPIAKSVNVQKRA